MKRAIIFVVALAAVYWLLAPPYSSFSECMLDLSPAKHLTPTASSYCRHGGTKWFG